MTTSTLELPSTPVAAPSTTRGDVLVVDDEECNRVLLRDPLEAQNYAVTEAVNSQEALRRIAEQIPDVVLLDVMMPGMDGFQLCRRLKQDPATAHVPVLLITALSERKERLLGIQAGANDFLNKPVDITDLTLRVANAVYAKRLYDNLQIERDKCDRLLLNTLPRSIAERMKKGETSIADQHEQVTVLVADLVGFTALTNHVEPGNLVALLNEIFSAFDILAGKHSLEKIKTIGDAYMAVGGIPEPRPDHAEAIIALAVDLRKSIFELNEQYATSFRLRIGIATGPVIAGVIGRKKFAYDAWGQTVNLACRLETLGEPDAIYLSESTYDKVKGRYRFGPGQQFEAKGIGQITAYRLAVP